MARFFQAGCASDNMRGRARVWCSDSQPVGLGCELMSWIEQMAAPVRANYPSLAIEAGNAACDAICNIVTSRPGLAVPR
jgi:hypothetical protein